MYHPTLDEVRQLKQHGNLVAVYREINADLETPVSAYLKIARGDYSFLLESVEGGERLARYSFIGTEPSLILKTGDGNSVDPLLMIEKEFQKFRLVPVAGLPRFHGGMVGYLAFNERYDPRIDAWSRIETPVLEQWQGLGAAFVSPNIYAIGGWNGANLSVNEAYQALFVVTP